MYHDQIITPFKQYLNLTNKFNFRLKILEGIPDHGTATNLIGKNKANDESLTNAYIL